MMVTGRILSPKNMRLFALSGALLISFAWLFASFSTTLTQLTFSYGVLSGIGVGMLYGIPVFIIQKEFSNRSGLYTGLVLLGFGMSPLITAPLANGLLTSIGLKQTFFFFSIVSFIVLVPLSMFLKTSAYSTNSQQHIDKGLSRKRFVGIYAMFLIATTIGLMMIGLSYRIGVANYNFNRNHIAILVSLFAICNGVARPIFGQLMDKKGFDYTARLSILLIVIAAIISSVNQGRFLTLYAISFSLFWFNLGAWLAIAPAAIKEFYGLKNYSKNYGLMFTAYGFGAIIGVLLSGMIIDRFNNTTLLYLSIIFILVTTFIVDYLIYLSISKKRSV
ncbi:MFS transporter [Liberiplasma polymorphum]|uniref:MFS transporter n=1 Tax=Liberiplasma polymorphum TaxID=3374570 RepID=UPI003774F454